MPEGRLTARWNSRNWQGLALLVLVLPPAAWVVSEAQRTFRADLASSSARLQVVSWVSGGAAPASASEWESARAALQLALDITPDDPGLQASMGDLQVVAGQRDWADEALRRQHFSAAATFYAKAIALREREPQTWATLALSYQAAAADPQQVHAAWSRALALGPFEGHVQPVLMEVVLSDWDGAAPAMRSWATKLFDDASESKRNGINAMARRYGLKFSPDAHNKP